MNPSLTDFVLFIVVASFVLVPLIAIVSRTLHLRVEKHALANRVICRLCLHAFEDTSHNEIVRCPNCGAANEKHPASQPG